VFIQIAGPHKKFSSHFAENIFCLLCKHNQSVFLEVITDGRENHSNTQTYCVGKRVIY